MRPDFKFLRKRKGLMIIVVHVDDPILLNNNEDFFIKNT
jgi:hypothetical protein